MAIDDRRLVRISKYLAKHLRHQPERLGLSLEPGGWVEVSALLDGCRRHNFPLTVADLQQVVRGNDKQRFSFDATGTKLRANQGHTVPVDLQLQPADPPHSLFHGTHQAAVKGIVAEGLRPMGRHHVHLSTTEEAARRVGARRGRPVVLAVDARAMVADGATFYVSANGVWLTAAVPARFVQALAPEGRAGPHLKRSRTPAPEDGPWPCS